jgi:hypothetical protein
MKEKTFRDIFCEHFWITTSGFFSDTALVCSMMEMVEAHASGISGSASPGQASYGPS